MTTKLETEMWLFNDTYWRWDRSVTIMTSQGLPKKGILFQFPVAWTGLSLLQSDKIRSAFRPGSFSIDTDDSFPEYIKRQEREADHSPLSRA